LMKERGIGIITLIALLLGIVVLSGIIVQVAVLPRLGVYAYAKSVPVQYGYDSVKEYWMISAVVSESEAFKLVLPSGAEEKYEEAGETFQAKTRKEVGLLITPLNPYSTAPLTKWTLKYYSSHYPFVYGESKTPSYDVQDGSWLTTARYYVGVYKSGQKLAEKYVEWDYEKQQNRVVKIQIWNGTEWRTVEIVNEGIILQGVEVPSGDLVLVYDPYGKYHLFAKTDFKAMIDAWNDHVYRDVFTFGEWDWKDVWEWARDNGYLPEDVHLRYVSQVSLLQQGDVPQKVVLKYSGIAFSAMITCFIPADLAETVIIQLFTPKPIITKIEPSKVPLDILFR